MSGALFAGDALSPFRFKHPAGRQHGEDYIYVLAFSTDVVKVGYTSNPAYRIGDLITAVAVSGSTVTKVWVSEPHLNARDTERELLDRCRRVATSSNGEYFTGLVFDDVVTTARASGGRERLAPGERVGAPLVFEVVRQLREANGLTLRGLARRAQISPGFLSKLERGLTDASPEMVARLAGVLNVPMGALTAGDDHAAYFAKAMAQARGARLSPHLVSTTQ